MPEFIPDLAGALKLYLEASSQLTNSNLVGNRIFIGWPNNTINVPPFVNLIIIETGKGGPGSIGLGLITERVQFKCYGANPISAHTIWRTLHYYLMKSGIAERSSFILGHTAVLKIEDESAPLRLFDKDASNWPYTLGTYMCTYSERYIP